MPTRPPRAHAQGQPPKPRQQVSPRKLGYDTRWDKARAEFLKTHRFCECDLHKGTPGAPLADTVDHIVPHKGDRELFWNRRNWRAMTKSCHSTKTGRYDRPESRRVDGEPGAIPGGDREARSSRVEDAVHAPTVGFV